MDIKLKKTIARQGLIILFSVSILALCQFSINSLNSKISEADKDRDSAMRHFKDFHPLRQEYDKCDAFGDAQRLNGARPPIPDGHPCREVIFNYAHDCDFHSYQLYAKSQGDRTFRDILKTVQFLLIGGLLIFYAGRFIIWAIKTLRDKKPNSTNSSGG